MDIPAIIAHLRANCPVFNQWIAGAAEFNVTMAGEFRPETFPAAYVVPLGATATPNDESNSIYQLMTERVGVVVEFSNVADRRGQSVTEMYAPTQKEIFAALLNWRGTDIEHALRGFEFESADTVSPFNDRARIFYQWIFTLESQLTEIDGWQEPLVPLVEIRANSDPTDPPPGASVHFPLP